MTELILWSALETSSYEPEKNVFLSWLKCLYMPIKIVSWGIIIFSGCHNQVPGWWSVWSTWYFIFPQVWRLGVRNLGLCIVTLPQKPIRTNLSCPFPASAGFLEILGLLCAYHSTWISAPIISWHPSILDLFPHLVKMPVIWEQVLATPIWIHINWIILQWLHAQIRSPSQVLQVKGGGNMLKPSYCCSFQLHLACFIPAQSVNFQ